MPYHIFVSHTGNDKIIAEELTRVINNAFEGDIQLYLAFQEIGGGDEWKKSIRDNLQKCDALICLVTPEYARKPWLFIEWSAFWLADKKYYILLTDDVKVSDLVHPMQDRQATNITDDVSVRMFFRSLASDSKHAAIPYPQVKTFVESVKDAIFIRDKEKMDKSYGKYKDSLDELPEDDNEKRSIAEYFYNRDDFDTYEKIVSKIRDESVKSSMVIRLIKQGDLSRGVQISEKILGADKILDIVLNLIDLQHHDSRQVRDLVDNISTKNQSELRKIAVYLLNRGEGDSELFNYVLEDLTNMAEVRKIASNVIADGQQKSEVFNSLFEKIRLSNQREAEKVMVELWERDKELFLEILKKGLITNPVILKRLEDLSSK
ncbi:MAG: TIR domain-containing protein [Anaerolineales bacterium]|nr:TIR domain-containing protein [Anaerolineales bacterium]